MISRFISNSIKNSLFKGKVIIVLGARQVGKTTLLKELFSSNKNVLWLNADNIEIQELFEIPSSSRFKNIIGNHKIVVIDEAQRIKNIGIKLKIFVDEISDIQVVATGSSSLDIANEIMEPLTGRKFQFYLYPLSFAEMVQHGGLLAELNLLNQRLIYGYYPEVVTSQGNEKKILNELINSYLFKDILAWNKVKKSDKLVKLLRALAFQVGSQVSYHELGQWVGLDNETVEKYIVLLEQCFIVFRLPSFSRNLRNELKKGQKIYFYDNGIRNALIANLNPIELRNDVGALWENFLVSERKKVLTYHEIYANMYFWRNLLQQEIDYIEEVEGKLHAYEFKWNKPRKTKLPKAFNEAYPDVELKIINRDNFEEFIILK